MRTAETWTIVDTEHVRLSEGWQICKIAARIFANPLPLRPGSLTGLSSHSARVLLETRRRRGPGGQQHATEGASLVELQATRQEQTTVRFQIGLLLFPRLTQLDLTGPYEVFIRFPDTDVHLVSKTLDPVVADGGMRLLPSSTFAECPKLDLVCVPGGAGMNPLLNDQETLDFLNLQASGARYVTSVCTGALVLGAAGLLRGKRATTHWMSLPMLAAFGCEPVAERVVVDGNVITGGGVTAGIDFALTVASELRNLSTTLRQRRSEFTEQAGLSQPRPAG